jgi:hypothetical protein
MILFLLFLLFIYLYTGSSLTQEQYKENTSRTVELTTKKKTPIKHKGSYLEVASSKGKLYRRTFSGNKKLYPVNPIFYDLIIEGGNSRYIHNRFSHSLRLLKIRGTASFCSTSNKV